jgi:hypothetical protein
MDRTGQDIEDGIGELMASHGGDPVYLILGWRRGTVAALCICSSSNIAYCSTTTL